MQGLLRDGLLEGRRVAAAGPVRASVREALSSLGAEVVPLDVDLADEPATEAAAGALGPVGSLVVDSATLFASGRVFGDGPEEAVPLRAALDGAWSAARAVANAAWIPREAPGKIVFVAPSPDAGPHAEAARDALENLARTASIEWARFGIKPVAVTPGVSTSEDEVASLVAYLVSPAGDYFSGARLSLGVASG